MKNDIVYIPVDWLIPHPQNPRKNLGDLTELADSIRANGIYQNMTVVPTPDKLDTFTVIIGHRRLAAAKLAGLTEVPCVIADMTEKQQLETMLLENMQRTDLTIPEEAQGLQLLIDLGEDVPSLAAATGFSKAKIKSRLRLSKYDTAEVEQAFIRGATLEDYAKLDKIKDEKTRMEVAKELGTNNFEYRCKAALERQTWEEEKPKIIDYLIEQGAKQVKSDPNWETRARYNYAYSMQEAKRFFEEKDNNRRVVFCVPTGGYNPRYIGVFELRTAEELEERQKSKQKPTVSDPNRELRNKMEAYHDALKDSYYSYIAGAISGFSDCLPAQQRIEILVRLADLLLQFEIETGSAFEGDAAGLLDLLEINVESITEGGEDGEDRTLDEAAHNKLTKKIKSNPVKYWLAICWYMLVDPEASMFYNWSGKELRAEHFDQKYTIIFLRILEDLGLRFPDGLMEYFDGTHPIYTEEGFAKLIAEPEKEA